MATVTLAGVQDRWPTNTVVGAYPDSNWPATRLPPSGAAPGSATATGTVSSAGALVITGLAEDTHYWLGASVSGTWRYSGVSAGDLQTVDARLGAIESNQPIYAADAPYNVVADGLSGSAAANTTGLRAALIAAAGRRRVVLPPGTIWFNDSLLTDATTVTSWFLDAVRTERGAGAEEQSPGFAATILKFRPADTTKWLATMYRTDAPAAFIGPFMHRNIRFDFGDANGLRFGKEDLNDDDISDEVVNGAGQRFVDGVRFEHCALSATAADFTLNADGSFLTPRSGRTMLHLTKCFESGLDEVSLHGGDTQVRTWGCDKPSMKHVRSFFSHVPFDFNASGGFSAQHTFEDIQVEGWTLTPVKSKDVELAATNTRFENFAAAGGKRVLTATAAVTAGSGTLTFSSSMNGILFPGISVIKLTSGANEINALVKTVSGTTVTVEHDAVEGPIDIPFSAGAATVTRYHGCGPIHYSVYDAGYTNIAAIPAPDTPVAVYVLGRGQMSLTNGQTQSGLGGDTRAMVVGNRLGAPGYLDGVMAFAGCTPLFAAPPGHPLVINSDQRDGYGNDHVAGGTRALRGDLAEILAIPARKWVFAPGLGGEASAGNSNRVPMVALADETNTAQKVWAWHLRAGEDVWLADETFPNNATMYLRLRIKWRSVGATGNASYYFLGNGGGGGATVALTSAWSVYERVFAVPGQWQGVRTPPTSMLLDTTVVDPFYVASVTIEEIPSSPAIANPTGGAIIDVEARAQLNAALASLRAHGLVAS